ncbi:transposase, partial [Mobilitalea sibirica]
MTNNNTNDTKILDLNQTMNDFIVGLMKQTMERLMQEELSNVLQYEKYSYDGHGTGNSRNGSYARDYETRYGTIHDLKIPRDRNNEFNQQLIPPYARRDDWLENLIIRMYASGVSTREIACIIEKLYGNSYSAATISNITDVAIDEVDKWHKRDLKKRYSIIYIDALHVKLRRTTVDSDAVYFILGIDEDGYREVIDFFIGTNESSYVWEENLHT